MFLIVFHQNNQVVTLSLSKGRIKVKADKMKDITVKWTDKGKPLVYERRGVRWVQLTRRQIIEMSTAGIYHHPEVMAWLSSKDAMHGVSSTTRQPELVEGQPSESDQGPLKPNTRELYEYLESLYGPVEPIGSRRALYTTTRSVGKGKINFND